jgi:hypothetical protein
MRAGGDEGTPTAKRCVRPSPQTASGQHLVVKYLNQLSSAMIETHTEVLTKGMSGLLDVMVRPRAGSG